MMEDFTFLNMLAPKSKDMQHGQLILRLLIAGEVLDNSLPSAIDGDSYQITGLNNMLNHIANVSMHLSAAMPAEKLPHHFIGIDAA